GSQSCSSRIIHHPLNPPRSTQLVLPSSIRSIILRISAELLASIDTGAYYSTEYAYSSIPIFISHYSYHLCRLCPCSRRRSFRIQNPIDQGLGGGLKQASWERFSFRNRSPFLLVSFLGQRIPDGSG